MEINSIITNFSILASGIGIVASGITAAWNFQQKARETARAGRQARQNEILRLQENLKSVKDIFSNIFDYITPLDTHLRIDNLAFTPEEVETRSRVDDGFEHLRDVHRSVSLGLMEKTDIGPWVYWIYRVETRPPLHRYAEACGYSSFMEDLILWASSSRELAILKTKCPWI